MRSQMNIKLVPLDTGTGAVSTISNSVDTKGFNFAKFCFFSDSTGTLTTATAITESDDNSTFSAIAGFVNGTDYTVSSSTNLTTVAKLVLGMNLRGRKRYLKATVTHATAGRTRFWCELSDPSDGVTSATDTNTANLISL